MYKAACMLLRSRCLSWAAVVECRYRSNCFKTQRSCQAAKLWVKKHKPALFRKPSMILWSSAKKKKQQPAVCVSDVHFHQKADHQKEGICKWQSVHRVDGKHGGCTGRRCDYFSVPQEAVAGLKAQLIRSCSRKLNYIVREERERFLGKNAQPLRHRDDFQKLEIELCCWQNHCLVCVWVCWRIECVSVRRACQMEHRQ